MSSYLIFSLIFCNTFERLFPKEDVNFREDPIQCWHPCIHRHKSPFHFYRVQDAFVGRFQNMTMGEGMSCFP